MLGIEQLSVEYDLIITAKYIYTESRVISVAIVIRLLVGWRKNWGLIPGRGQEIFPFSTASKPALGPIHQPIQRVPGAVFPGINRTGRDLPLISDQSLQRRPTGSTVWVRFPAWARNLSVLQSVQTLSPEVKRPRSEADHSHPSNDELNNNSVIPPLPPYVFLVKKVKLLL
jgi:hypothetical protein